MATAEPTPAPGPGSGHDPAQAAVLPQVLYVHPLRNVTLGIVIDCAHASFRTTMAVLESPSRTVIISHSHLDHPDRLHPPLLADAHARAVASVGCLIGAWPSGVTSRTLCDFAAEIIRLAEIARIGHVVIGTDMEQLPGRPHQLRSAPRLGCALNRHGLGVIAKVLGGNPRRPYQPGLRIAGAP